MDLEGKDVGCTHGCSRTMSWLCNQYASHREVINHVKPYRETSCTASKVFGVYSTIQCVCSQLRVRTAAVSVLGFFHLSARGEREDSSPWEVKGGIPER